MRTILAGGVAALALMTAGAAQAEPVKIGVITTLSGGGAGLGIDMRDAFQLAIKQSGNNESNPRHDGNLHNESCRAVPDLKPVSGGGRGLACGCP